MDTKSPCLKARLSVEVVSAPSGMDAAMFVYGGDFWGCIDSGDESPAYGT